jgi:RimJ/RimL family protein N-acetyltransferase
VAASRLPYPLTLTGDGIVLREWSPDDLDDLVEMLDEPDIARWTPMTSPFDIAAGIAYLKRATWWASGTVGAGSRRGHSPCFRRTPGAP